jgi:polyisoprenoid-binding protein YceI
MFLTIYAIMAFPMTAQGQDVWRVIPDACHVGFTFHSSLSDTKGDAMVLSGEWNEFQNGASRFVFPVNQLKTHNTIMDRHMYRMFEIEKYPQIFYTLQKLSMSLDQKTADVTGSLTIHGVTRNFPITAQVHESNGIKEFKGHADISLKTFELKAPSFLMLKVADRVDVTFDISLSKASDH